MLVTQVCIGRFHHFHLARQLEKHGLLNAIYTGYPRFKLFDENKIRADKIRAFPWLQAPYMAINKIGISQNNWLNREWSWQAHQTLDKYVARCINQPTILIALSGSGLHAGKKTQALGGIHICDRGSSHIRTQNQLLTEEYQRYGSKWQGIDQRSIDKEEAEYLQAQCISVPSQFCYESFLKQGISADKLLKIPYGARLERFYPDTSEQPECDEFQILFVGAAGPRKGFIDLLEAFKQVSHPHKHLVLIGSLSDEAKVLLKNTDQENITFIGPVANNQLRQYFSSASVFVLPSIEEGLAMVCGEAMACACPVIATTNTGASELITNGVEGFIVPIRSPQIIANHLQQLADNPECRRQMGQAALAKVRQLMGWDAYGDSWAKKINEFKR